MFYNLKAFADNIFGDMIHLKDYEMFSRIFDAFVQQRSLPYYCTTTQFKVKRDTVVRPI